MKKEVEDENDAAKMEAGAVEDEQPAQIQRKQCFLSDETIHRCNLAGIILAVIGVVLIICSDAAFDDPFAAMGIAGAFSLFFGLLFRVPSVVVFGCPQY